MLQTPVKEARASRVVLFGYAVSVLASLALVLASLAHWVPLDITEALGFVTGGWGVWLTVKENVWNWPIGIASSLFYTVLFFDARLFADMTLQVVYVVLGFLGWYWWLHGGENKAALRIARTPRLLWLLLLVLTVAVTYGMTLFLTSVKDSAPFLDALTTTLSLVATYLAARKLIENWHLWFVTDAIYVGLYIYKGLYLTSLLYAVFVLMCVFGIRNWQQIMALTIEEERRPVELDAV